LGDEKTTLTPGGQCTSTFNFEALHKKPIGEYTIALIGTSGSL